VAFPEGLLARDKMKLSIFRKIFLGVIAVHIVTAAVIIAWFFYSIRSEINGIETRNAQETVLQSIEATEKYFVPVETGIQETQQLISRNVLQRERPAQLVRYLHDQLGLWQQFAGIYVGYPDGDFYYVMRDNEVSAKGTRTKVISHSGGQRAVTLTWRNADYSTLKTSQDPADTYDPRARPWYHAAVTRTEVVWTAPYIFFTSRKPGITAAVAVRDERGELTAVVGIDIEISAISKYLRQIAFGPQRSAFMVSPEGEIISHSNMETVLLGNTSGNEKPRFLKLGELTGIDQPIKDSIAARLSDQAASNVPAAWQEQSENGNYIIAMGRISSADWPWQIVTIRPEADIIEAARGSNLVLIAVVLFATGFTIAIGYVLARNLGRPLAVLWNNAKLALNGNTELMEDVASGYDEIDGTAAIIQELGEAQRHRSSSPPAENSRE
jgi:two-component system cell cycle sensor histidine kinase/response regulator CckA